MKLLLLAALALTPLHAEESEPVERLKEAAAVFSERMATTDANIPQELLAKAHCIVIVPGLKTAAFIIGAKYGKGYLSCRSESPAGWSAPGTVRIEGGSAGFQMGGSSTDLIMLVMSERGADKLLASKFTLGVEGSVAAGPVGRTATAPTDAQMRADLLSWSRSRGLFAGVALQGATLRQDLNDNAKLYGDKLENREIVTTNIAAPHAAEELLALLNKHPARAGYKVAAAPRLAHQAKPSPMGSTETPKTLSRGEIRTAQASLNEKGFDVGAADGKMGSRTRAGIREFQTSEQMPLNGLLDAQTAGKLGVQP